MRSTSLVVLSLVAIFSSFAQGQALIQYGGVGATSTAGASQAGRSMGGAFDKLGKKLGEATGGARAGGTEHVHPRPSPSPDERMRANRQTLEKGARKQGAVLHVACVPQGATLYVDYQAVGRAPAELPLPAGKHILELKAPGYLNWSQEVTASAGKTLSFELKLQEYRPVQSDKRIIQLPF